jgi:adenosylcobinamide kinase/adenosylcobinamide-phosphate guanylyltransferase
MKNELVFVIGGARSGKSSFALNHAESKYKRPLFLATAKPTDEEMAERIRLHRAARDERWGLLEEPIELAAALKGKCLDADVLLIDCLTVWLGNLLLAYPQRDVEGRIEEFLLALEQRTRAVVVVANEVGCGVVPPYPLGRLFRDMAGRLNQAVAARADRVVLTVAGIPVTIKDSSALI